MNRPTRRRLTKYEKFLEHEVQVQKNQAGMLERIANGELHDPNCGGEQTEPFNGVCFQCRTSKAMQEARIQMHKFEAIAQRAVKELEEARLTPERARMIVMATLGQNWLERTERLARTCLKEEMSLTIMPPTKDEINLAVQRLMELVNNPPSTRLSLAE